MTTLAPTEVAMAAGDPNCERTFLGMRPWYMGLTETTTDATGKSSCIIKSPGGSEAELSTFVWTIVLNVLADLTLLVGYVALGFIIWGGFKYILSNGEPSKVAQAKTTLTNAMIGLVIAILSTVIVNTILAVFGGAAS